MKFISLVYITLSIVLTHIVNAKKIFSCVQNKTIAMTFDDGPFEYTNELVEYVKTQPDVRITFFTVAHLHYPHADETEEIQAAMKNAHDAGFQIASHTYYHKIPEDEDEFKKTLSDMDEFIGNVTGDRPRYFRAPKGHCEEDCQQRLDKWGYKLIQWDVDTKDWDLETSGSESQRVKDSINILKKEFAEERDNYLILMHDSENYTVREIAPWILEKSGMKEKGYRFVTVAECLGDKEGMYHSGKVPNDPSSITAANKTQPVILTSDRSLGNNTILISENDFQNLNTSKAYSLKSIALMPYLLLSFITIFLLLSME